MTAPSSWLYKGGDDDSRTEDESLKSQTDFELDTPITSSGERPRRVTFCDEMIEEISILGISSYTKDEVSSSWYSAEEMVAMRPKAKFAAALHKNCGPDCARGLENRTRAGMERRRRNMISAGFAVLEEQRMQSDPVRIAAAYMRRTRHCHNAAFLRGLIDEQQLRRHIHPSLPRSAISLKAQEHPNWEVMDVCTCHEIKVNKSDEPITTKKKTKKRGNFKSTKPSSGMIQGVMQRLRRNRGPLRSKAFVGCAKDDGNQRLLGPYVSV